MTQPLSIMSTLALNGVLDVLAPLWAERNPAPAMVFDPTKSISQRIADGARGDDWRNVYADRDFDQPGGARIRA